MTSDHEKIQAAIVEVLGYKPATWSESDGHGYVKCHGWLDPYNNGCLSQHDDLPNWLSSLDACKELWQVIFEQSDEVQSAYKWAIEEYFSSPGKLSLLEASPLDHCQAFLTVMWKE